MDQTDKEAYEALIDAAKFADGMAKGQATDNKDGRRNEVITYLKSMAFKWRTISDKLKARN